MAQPMPARATVPHMRFDTAALPAAQQFDAWRDAVGVTHEVLAPPRGARAGFLASAAIWQFGPLLLTDGATEAQRFVRTERRARRDGIDHYSLLLMRRGQWQGELGGRHVIGGPGSLCLRDMADPLATSVSDGAHLMLMLPRDTLGAVRPAPAEGHGLMLHGTLGRLLADHMRALATHLPHMLAGEVSAVVQATRHLVAACLNPSADALARARPPLAAASLRSAKRLIEARLHDPALSPAQVAQALGVTRSTLYRLFEPQGGIGAYIRARRLARIRTLLADPTTGGRIADLAYAHGFVSEAHFSRAFRQAFGLSPREARASLRPAGPAAPAAGAEDAAAVNYHAWVRSLGE